MSGKARALALVDCTAVLMRTLADLTAGIGAAQAIVTYDPLPTLTASETELSQVFQNLISNAIKYRSIAPCRIHVSVSAEPAAPTPSGIGPSAPRMWHFSVRDNGIGIDPQYSKKIFVIFQRLHPRSQYAGKRWD